MKAAPLFIVVLLTGCAVHDTIFMKETPLRLTSVQRKIYSSGSNLALKWQTLDGNIHIETEAPLEDSSLYRVGTIYSRCFLPK